MLGIFKQALHDKVVYQPPQIIESAPLVKPTEPTSGSTWLNLETEIPQWWDEQQQEWTNMI
jgi:hypothetical protein